MNTVHQLIRFRNQSFYLNINDFQSINILQYTETKNDENPPLKSSLYIW